MLRQFAFGAGKAVPYAALDPDCDGLKMKFDPEIVRNLLLQIEAEHTGPESYTSISSQDYARHYAATLMREAGYIVGYNLPDNQDEETSHLVIERMTIQGHEFLDGVRDDGIWAAAKEGGKTVGGATLETLFALAKGFARKKLEQHFDVKL
jgi:Hypothetical protein (DUF2513)